MSDAQRVTAADERLRTKFPDVGTYLENWHASTPHTFRRKRCAGTCGGDLAEPGIAAGGNPSAPRDPVVDPRFPGRGCAFAHGRHPFRTAAHGRCHPRVDITDGGHGGGCLFGEGRAVCRRRPGSGERILSTYLDDDHLADGAFVLLVDPAGRIFAASPAAAGQVGLMLSTVLPEVTTIQRSVTDLCQACRCNRDRVQTASHIMRSSRLSEPRVHCFSRPIPCRASTISGAARSR